MCRREVESLEERHCSTEDEPFNLLLHYILCEDWDSAITRVTLCPNEAKWECRYKWTVLHWVCCFHDAPPSLVHALLQAHPDVSYAEDQYGLTPLHYQWGVSFVGKSVLQDIRQTVNTGLSFEELSGKLSRLVTSILSQVELQTSWSAVDGAVWSKLCIILSVASPDHQKESRNRISEENPWGDTHACPESTVSSRHLYQQLATIIHSKQAILQKGDEKVLQSATTPEGKI